jgi:hypothetical protein
LLTILIIYLYMYLVISILFDLLCHNKRHFFFLIIYLMVAKGFLQNITRLWNQRGGPLWGGRNSFFIIAPYRFISANLASVRSQEPLFSPLNTQPSHTHAIFCTHLFDFLCDSLTVLDCIFAFAFVNFFSVHKLCEYVLIGEIKNNLK